MTPSQTKQCLIVRGGWDGHQPVETTELFRAFLAGEGYGITVSEGPAPYADRDLMETIDLVVQCVTMASIEPEEVEGLRQAVARGTGLAGWHGGIADSYRASSEYLQLVGGQFVCHPSKHPDDWRRDGTDSDLHHRIHLTDLGRAHPILESMDDFDLVTEQYWVLTDDHNDVLATTTVEAREWDPWVRPIVAPAIWTRQWGKGRVFVATPGHNDEVMSDPNVRAIVERGMLWASR